MTNDGWRMTRGMSAPARVPLCPEAHPNHSLFIINY